MLLNINKVIKIDLRRKNPKGSGTILSDELVLTEKPEADWRVLERMTVYSLLPTRYEKQDLKSNEKDRKGMKKTFLTYDCKSDSGGTGAINHEGLKERNR